MQRAKSRAGMLVTSVALEPDLHRLLAIMAVTERIAQAEVIRRAVREWLDRHRKLAPPARVAR